MLGVSLETPTQSNTSSLSHVEASSEVGTPLMMQQGDVDSSCIQTIAPCSSSASETNRLASAEPCTISPSSTKATKRDKKKGFALREGYESWCVTIEHPDLADVSSSERSQYLAMQKVGQWKLNYRHGSFPARARAGMLLAYRGRSYILLEVGTNTLRVRAITADLFYAAAAQPAPRISALQHTPERTERLLRRRDGRHRSYYEDWVRRPLDDPQFQQEQGSHFCYELTMRELPRTLCDALPTWARGGKSEESEGAKELCEEPTALARSCYLQLFTIQKEHECLVSWHPYTLHSQSDGFLPECCRIVVELGDFSQAPVFSLTDEEATQLVQSIEQAEKPALETFVAPAFFLEPEMRAMIAPSLAWGASQYRPSTPSHSRVSLDAGQHIAIPQEIAKHRIVDTVTLSPATVAALQQAEITCFEQLLELEEEQLRKRFTSESLRELFLAAVAAQALPQVASQVFAPEEMTQERELTHIAQFEIAARKGERIFCQFEDTSVQEVSRVRTFGEILQTKCVADGPWLTPERIWTTERDITRRSHFDLARSKGERVLCQCEDTSIQEVLYIRSLGERLQTQRLTDGLWITPSRFWIPVRKRAEVTSRKQDAFAPPRWGFLPCRQEPRDEGQDSTTMSEVFFYQLTGISYDDVQRGRLYLVYASSLLERLDGRKSGSVQTLWLTQEQVRQSTRWERALESLDSLELQERVTKAALTQGADLPTVPWNREQWQELQSLLQDRAEEAFNRVPVRSPYSTQKNPTPLRLYISDWDVRAAHSDRITPTAMVLKVLKQYIRHPEMMPLDYRLDRHVLEDLLYYLQQDQRQLRQLRDRWARTFLGVTPPDTQCFVLHKAYKDRSRMVIDHKSQKKVVEKTQERVGFWLIVGLLASGNVSPDFVIKPRQGTHTASPKSTQR